MTPTFADIFGPVISILIILFMYPVSLVILGLEKKKRERTELLQKLKDKEARKEARQFERRMSKVR